MSCAVAKAAMESGVARKDIEDWDAYRLQLRELMAVSYTHLDVYKRQQVYAPT